MANGTGTAVSRRTHYCGRDGIAAFVKGTTHPMSAKLPQSTPVLRLYLVGAFRLCDGTGRVISLRNRKAQALLALLALSPRGERSRVWLRDKLWSGSDEKKSSTSLRQTLFEIRRDLGALAERALDIRTQSISFRPGKVWVDYETFLANPSALSGYHLSPDTDLLEGFDIVDPEFEDWLSVERGIWADRAEQILAIPTPRPQHGAPGVDTGRASSTSLALMRSVMHGGDALSLHLADRVMEGIANSLRELQPVKIFDLRDQNGAIEDLAASAQTEFYCRLRLLRIGESVTLTLLVHSVSRMAMEWSQSIQCRIDDLIAFDGQILQGFIAQNVDRLARTLLTAGPQGSPEADLRRSGYAAMNLIFRLNDAAFDHAMDLLAPKDAPSSELHVALRSYVSSFRIGDNIGRLTAQARAMLRNETGAEMDGNPFNSIALACFGHVLGYVFQEHDAAGRLLERAVRLNPAQAFAWDHFALHKIYTGDYTAARRAAERAVSLGAYSPISFSYETTLAMAATLSGDYDRAIMAGHSAMHKQPLFKPAQRYLMVAHSARGERDKAEALRDGLLAADPDFQHADVQEMRFGAGVMQRAQTVQTEMRKLMI